jgi:hypothetical protein
MPPEMRKIHLRADARIAERIKNGQDKGRSNQQRYIEHGWTEHGEAQ